MMNFINIFTISFHSGSAIPGDSAIIESLFPNVWSFIAHILATIILVSMIIFFAWKPTKKYLERRRKDILKNVDEAKEKNKMAFDNFENSKQELFESKQKASNIIQTATLESEQIKKDMESKTRIKIAKMEQKSIDDLKKMENDASLNLSKYASELAIEIAESLMKKKLDKKANDKMVNDILEEIEKSKK